ncbi:MAG: hypothetical protein ACLFUV_02595 [Methanomassiliicoccales archaeon]
MDKAFDRLAQLVDELPDLTEGKLNTQVIPRAGLVIGNWDFEFERGREPNGKMIRLLMFNLHEVMTEISCRYRIVTVEASSLES